MVLTQGQQGLETWVVAVILVRRITNQTGRPLSSLLPSLPSSRNSHLIRDSSSFFLDRGKHVPRLRLLMYRAVRGAYGNRTRGSPRAVPNFLDHWVMQFLISFNITLRIPVTGYQKVWPQLLKFGLNFSSVASTSQSWPQHLKVGLNISTSFRW